MKKLQIVGWISTGVAVVILFLAFIVKVGGVKIFTVTHVSSYFILANSFLLLAIAIFIGVRLCYYDKCECKEEKKE
jgi:Na+(H+)/acetate symporter ActP